jgi:EAL domain-containing protein (putative c-di-GMP-specific phosphodiesterase class I)
MAINVTHHDLSGLDFLQIVEWRLEEAGLDWSHLSFELTERSILDDPHRDVEKTLSAIRERGGEVALDDFGTGHAGLLHLRDWPIDVLKLDATFVRDASDNGRNEAILKSMIELAERLDLQVIAEGIEAVGIAEKLREMGCSCGQGFLFSPAVSQPDALELLSGKAQTSFSVGRPGRAL